MRGLLAVAGASVVACGGLESVRAADGEWLHLNRESIDLQVGAYYDTVSGVFVEYEIGLPGMVSALVVPSQDSTPAARVTSGVSGGWHYALSVSEDSAAQQEDSCPSESGAETINISFAAEGTRWAVWNLSAVACSADQKERIMSFLLGSQPRWHDTLQEQHRPDSVLAKSVETLARGTRWDEVVSRLGHPQDSLRTRNGFRVSYPLSQEGGLGPAEVLLDFDREGLFVASNRVSGLGASR